MLTRGRSFHLESEIASEDRELRLGASFAALTMLVIILSWLKFIPPSSYYMLGIVAAFGGLAYARMLNCALVLGGAIVVVSMRNEGAPHGAILVFAVASAFVTMLVASKWPQVFHDRREASLLLTAPYWLLAAVAK